MAKRRWTVVLVPHGSEPSRIVEVSYGVLQDGVGASSASWSAGAPAAGYATVGPHHRSLAHRPAAAGERSPGAAASASCNGRLATLADTLTRIAQRDARIRVLANLEPIDPQVQAAGIGGPTLAPTPRAAGEDRADAALRTRSGSTSTR